MIVHLAKDLFRNEISDDTLLLEIFAGGRDGRFAIRVEGWPTRESIEVLERWLDEQSKNSQETVLLSIKRGQKHKQYVLPQGRREPVICIEVREQEEWPKSFDDGPARLPLSDVTRQLLRRPLGVLVENDRGTHGQRTYLEYGV